MTYYVEDEKDINLKEDKIAMKQVKKLSIAFLVFFCTLLTITLNPVNASRVELTELKNGRGLKVGDGVLIQYKGNYSGWTLTDVKNLICIEEGAPVHCDIDSTVRHVINVGTGYGAGSPRAVYSEATGRQNENDVNAKMAYILYDTVYNSARNSGYKSTGQRLVWNSEHGFAYWYNNSLNEILSGSWRIGNSSSFTNELQILNAEAEA